jgi:hypothetical protein
VITTDNGLGVPATAAGVLLGGGTLFANVTMTLDNAGVAPRPIGLLNQGGGLPPRRETRSRWMARLRAASVPARW